MHSLGCYSVVIVSFSGRMGKFAMAVMSSPNSSLKICKILQFDCLRVRVYNPGLIHTPFVYTLVLHCPFCFLFFSFLHGRFIHAGISAGCSLFKAQSL